MNQAMNSLLLRRLDLENRVVPDYVVRSTRQIPVPNGRPARCGDAIKGERPDSKHLPTLTDELAHTQQCASEKPRQQMGLASNFPLLHQVSAHVVKDFSEIV